MKKYSDWTEKGLKGQVSECTRTSMKALWKGEAAGDGDQTSQKDKSPRVAGGQSGLGLAIASVGKKSTGLRAGRFHRQELVADLTAGGFLKALRIL